MTDNDIERVARTIYYLGRKNAAEQMEIDEEELLTFEAAQSSSDPDEHSPYESAMEVADAVMNTLGNQKREYRPHPDTSFAVRIRNAIHALNLDRPDIAKIPDGGTALRNITTDRTIRALLEDILTASIKSNDWHPPHEWRRQGMNVVRSTLIDNNVYLQAKNGDIYRIWIEFDGMPSIECVAYNAALPKPEIEGQ